MDLLSLHQVLKLTLEHYRETKPAAAGFGVRFPWGDEDHSIPAYIYLTGERELEYRFPALTADERLSLAELVRSGVLGEAIVPVLNLFWPFHVRGGGASTAKSRWPEVLLGGRDYPGPKPI